MHKSVIYTFCFFLMIVGFSSDCFAQTKSDKLRPKWLTQSLPTSLSGNYTFFVATGEGKTLTDARQSSLIALTQKIEHERNLTVNSRIIISESISESQKFTDNEYHQEIELEVSEKGRILRIVCKEVDEYWTLQSGVYRIDVLYTVTDSNYKERNSDDIITVTTKYSCAGLLSIVPGVGQLYKGSTIKGLAIIGGAALASGGIVLCENTRASYVKKMKEQPRFAVEYNSLADSWETGRNICIGVIGAIYVYNLIDAIWTPGAKMVKVKSKKTTMAAVPYATDNSVGICVAINF